MPSIPYLMIISSVKIMHFDTFPSLQFIPTSFCITTAYFLYRKNQITLLAPTQPAMARINFYAQAAQAMQPGAQQRRGSHIGRKYSPGGANKGVYAQTMHPLSQGIRIKLFKGINKLRMGGIPRAKIFSGFCMSDVHAAHTGQ